VLRLGLRLSPQLALQHAHAHLVLPQRLPAPALARVQAHQRPVHGLLQGVEGEQAGGRVHRAYGFTGLALVAEEPGQGIDRALAQTRPLGPQPVLEGFLGDPDPLEQVAPVQRDGLFEGLRGGAGGESLEGLRIDVDGGCVESQGVPIDDEDGRSRRG
jgi:hypothetical protein